MDFGTLVLAHLIGDFLFQNHWMQKKQKSSWHCFAHIVFYLIPFWFTSMPVWAVLAIGVQHFLQDRFGWAAKWQALIKQTPVEMWSQGRLYVDQTLHLVWIYAVLLMLR